MALNKLTLMGRPYRDPETRTQCCWVHKTANVLDKLPKRLQGEAKSMLHEMCGPIHG